MDPVKIRTATVEDVSALFTIRSRARAAVYPVLLSDNARVSFTIQNEESDKNLENWLKKFYSYSESDLFTLRVASEDDLLKGWYLVRHDPEKNHLLSMYVDPGAQGVGIGGLLLTDLIQRTGDKSLTLAVLKTNAGAIKFYEKHKFKESAELKATYLGVKRIQMKRA